MKFMVTVAVLLFVAAAAQGGEAEPRLKRGLKIYDLINGKSSDPKPEPAPAMVPKPQKPSKGFEGFNLEDALNPGPAVGNSRANAPNEQPDGGECQAEIMRKLNALFEIENLQMKMLQQMTGRGK